MPEDPKRQEQQIKKIVEQVVQEQMKKSGGPEQSAAMSKQEQQAAIDCVNAHNLAVQTLHYAEQMGGNMADPDNLNMLQDCADCCEFMNDLILRQSRMKAGFAELCEKACREAVKFAENFYEDPQMQNLLKYAKIASESVKQVNGL